MAASSSAWWAWLLPLLLGAPWIVGIAWCWRHRPRDGAIPPSMADLARQRLWPQ